MEIAINDALQEELKEFTDSIKSVSSSLSSSGIGEFEDITIDIEKVSGTRSKSLAAGAGSAAGAALGSFIFPGVGTAIGAIFGGFAGAKAGDYFVETTTVTETVGISTEQMINKTTTVVQKHLPKLVSDAVSEVIQLVSSTRYYASSVAETIAMFEGRIICLKEEK